MNLTLREVGQASAAFLAENFPKQLSQMVCLQVQPWLLLVAPFHSWPCFDNRDQQMILVFSFIGNNVIFTAADHQKLVHFMFGKWSHLTASLIWLKIFEVQQSRRLEMLLFSTNRSEDIYRQFTSKLDPLLLNSSLYKYLRSSTGLSQR